MTKARGKVPETSEKESEYDEQSQAQAMEGYACACGFMTGDLSLFHSHMLNMAKNKSSEEHRSLGRVNLESGEVTMPPADQRTPEQWKQAKYGKKPETSGKSLKTSKKNSVVSRNAPRPIDNIAGAVQVKFVPRVYTIDYSPILRMAQDAAIKYFGWREDMPFGNFLDTVMYLYFKDKGITLAGYVVEDNLEEEFQEERRVFEAQRSGQESEHDNGDGDDSLVPEDVLKNIENFSKATKTKEEVQA